MKRLPSSQVLFLKGLLTLHPINATTVQNQCSYVLFFFVKRYEGKNIKCSIFIVGC